MARVPATRPRPDKPWQDAVSAGGVVFDGRGRVLLLRRADEGTWCFPKGKIEPGESPEAAAAREIEEESGLTCAIGKEVAEVRYSYFSPIDDTNVQKRVVYFLAEPRGGDVRIEDRFDTWRWVPPGRAARMLPYRNDQTVLRRALMASDLTGKK